MWKRGFNKYGVPKLQTISRSQASAWERNKRILDFGFSKIKTE